MTYPQLPKKPHGNAVKVLFWIGIGGLLLRFYRPAIDKRLTGPLLPPQQVYPPVQPLLPRLEVPRLPPVELSEEGKRKPNGLLRGLKLSDLVPISSKLMEYPEPADAALARMVNYPAVVLAVGRRGGGKTAAILRMQELLRDVAPPYAIGLPAKASRLLPEWYGLAGDLADIPDNATVYFPESYRTYHARSTQSTLGRSLSDLVNLVAPSPAYSFLRRPEHRSAGPEHLVRSGPDSG